MFAVKFVVKFIFAFVFLGLGWILGGYGLLSLLNHFGHEPLDARLFWMIVFLAYLLFCSNQQNGILRMQLQRLEGVVHEHQKSHGQSSPYGD